MTKRALVGGGVLGCWALVAVILGSGFVDLLQGLPVPEIVHWLFVGVIGLVAVPVAGCVLIGAWLCGLWGLGIVALWLAEVSRA